MILRFLIIAFIAFHFSSCIVTTPARLSNTLPIDKIRMDETEVTVLSWLSYYSYVLNQEGKEAATKLLPDSTSVSPQVWAYISHPSPEQSNIYSSATGQGLGYFSKACRNFISYEVKRFPGSECPFLHVPITGVSYEQVQAFCEWRTKITGEGKIHYRLPTESEWNHAALKGLPNKQQQARITDSVNTSKCALFHYRGVKSCYESEYWLLKNTSTDRAGSYFPDASGIYDLAGNVSEMLSEKGLSKGENYLLYAANSHIDSVQTYSKPEIWLGFRCVAEEIKK